MTIQSLIDELSNYPKDAKVDFYMYEPVEDEGVLPMLINSIEENNNYIKIYLE